MHSSLPSGLVRRPRSIFQLLLSYQLIFIFLLWPTRPGSIFAESATNGTYMLGFLSPSPGTNIPASLATEWRSAFQVAVEVMNANRTSYQLVPLLEDSDCSFLPAQVAASKMLRHDGLIGAVGPVCSGAAIGAAPIFDLEGPAALVSFSATAEPLSSRAYFPTFFRTVYSDKHQANAIAASMERLSITNATLLYTSDYYSNSLANEINMTVGGVRMFLLEPGYNATVNRDQLKSLLNSLQPTDFVILVVQPTVARDIWKIAYQMEKTRYPWWYFGTDGATAFDPLDVGPELVNALEGEIGLAPYGGDFSSSSRCSEFYSHWQEFATKYPGLPATGANKSRSYVPYLFDAVIAFYEIIDDLRAAGLEVTRLNIYKAFNASGKQRVRYDGCTGIVEFDPETGARSVTAQPPVYDLVSMTVHSWEFKGRIANETFLALQPLERPGSYPAPGQAYYGPAPNSKRKASGGIIAGIVFLVVAIIVLLAACFVYFAKKCNSPLFVRIT